MLGAGTIFAPYPTFTGYTFDNAGNVAYGCLRHVSWSITVLWLVYCCCHRSAGIDISSQLPTIHPLSSFASIFSACDFSRELIGKQWMLLPPLLAMHWQRAFSVAAPTVWNGLPSNVRSCDSLFTFRRHLKTHYFTVAYAYT